MCGNEILDEEELGLVGVVLPLDDDEVLDEFDVIVLIMPHLEIDENDFYQT